MTHKINNLDFSAFDAQVLERNITNHEVVQVYDWLEEATEPLYIRTNSRFKDIELVVLIDSATDTSAYENIQKLVSELKMCTIKFDDLPHFYDCHFEGQVTQEKIYHGKIRLNILLSCYRTRGNKQSTTMNNTKTKVITNKGNLESPAVITLKPTANVPRLEIAGLSKKPVVLENLISDLTYVIDGERKLFTVQGASDISKYPNTAFPKIPESSTTVVLSTTLANVTIDYIPRYN